MGELRNELITIQALVNSIIVDVDRVNDTRLTDVDDRLQTLIETLEEMLELNTQYAQDVFEYLCEAPMEFTSILDPPESRNPGIEQLISQLNVIIGNQNEIEDMEAQLMKTPEQQMDEWNSKYPSGTRVNVTDDLGEVTEQVTRSIAWDVCGNAVVMISGRTGGYLLERCVPVED